jgi:hypothetical protein
VVKEWSASGKCWVVKRFQTGGGGGTQGSLGREEGEQEEVEVGDEGEGDAEWDGSSDSLRRKLVSLRLGTGEDEVVSSPS